MIKSKIQILKSGLGAVRTNLRGKKLKCKILVIESDDWGAIRTPSKAAISAFKLRGLGIANSIYKVDALASENDLNNLFDLLLQFIDVDGNHPAITANAIMANPDFDKIREAEFLKYYFEPFYETFKNYPNHSTNLELWKKGISEKVFMPQFHGREHLNINRWLKVLQQGDENAKFCFDWRATYSGYDDYSFMEAFDWNEPDDIHYQKRIIEEGLRIFEQTFGFKSTSFIAPCHCWDSAINSTLHENGIDILQGIRLQLSPTGSLGNYHKVPHYLGQKNQYGTIYNIRNCFFEPSSNKNYDWVNNCLAQIKIAFLMGAPAVISSHRINYVGFIDEKNRDHGLKNLKTLLCHVLRKWPDVRFVTTDNLKNYING